MIEAVFIFGALNIMFEFVLLSMLPVKTRLRLLGNEHAKAACHVVMLSLNLMVHWGTLIGSMASIVAFIASIMVMAFACKVYGFIINGRYYTVGWIKYKASELT